MHTRVLGTSAARLTKPYALISSVRRPKGWATLWAVAHASEAFRATMLMIAFAIYGCSPVADSSVANTGSAIHGGQPEYRPYVVALEINSESKCTGFLVGPHDVYTAGHCLVGAKWVKIYHLGTSDAPVSADYFRVTSYTNMPLDSDGELGYLYVSTPIRASVYATITGDVQPDFRYKVLGIQSPEGTSPDGRNILASTQYLSGESFACTMNPSGRACRTDGDQTHPGDSGSPLLRLNAQGELTNDVAGVTMGGIGETTFSVLTDEVLAALGDSQALVPAPERLCDWKNCIPTTTRAPHTYPCTNAEGTNLFCREFKPEQASEFPKCGIGCLMLEPGAGIRNCTIDLSGSPTLFQCDYDLEQLSECPQSCSEVDAQHVDGVACKDGSQVRFCVTS